jgi:hypothetical protein
MSLFISPNKLEFVDKNGLKFFNRFSAVDKKGRTVNLGIESPDDLTSIKVNGLFNNQLGFYDILLSPEKSEMQGVQLYVNKSASHANLGQILTLSSLMEFKMNKFANFKLFTLKETIPFHLKYGFVIDNKNPYFILDGIKQIRKSKAPNIDDIKQRANELYPKLTSRYYDVSDDRKLLEKGCNVVSEYITYLSRLNMKKEIPTFDIGTHLKLSSWDFERNKLYLNGLLKRHNIDFQF